MHSLPFQSQLNWVSGALNITGLLLYAWFTWRALKSPNTKKPLRFAWFLWCLLGVTYLSYQLYIGSFDGVPLLISEQIGITLIFVLTFRYGKGRLKPKGWRELMPGGGYWSQLMERNEIIGTAIAVAALALFWVESRIAVFSVAMCLIVDWMAAGPTIGQARLEPKTEPWYAWSFNAAGSALAIYCQVYNGPWPEFMYPASLLTMSLGVIIADQMARHWPIADKAAKLPVQPSTTLPKLIPAAWLTTSHAYAFPHDRVEVMMMANNCNT